MSIKITVTEEEVLGTPNYYEMGKKVHDRFWQAKRDQEGPQIDDEHFGMIIGEDGLVKSIIRSYTCSICNKDTSKVEYDYLVGYNHLTCVLEQENKTKQNEYDTCVICGKDSPYLRSTHIDMRFFYVEGSGQTCEDCYNK